MSNFTVALGVACLILAPLLLATYLFLGFRMGRAIAMVSQDLWDEMRPGFYSRMATSQAHTSRLRAFIKNREYETLDDPRITRLAIAFRITRAALIVCALGALATVAWALLG
jgi:hypothetical protein